MLLCSFCPHLSCPLALRGHQPHSPPSALGCTRFLSQELCVNTGVLLKKLSYQASFEFQISTTGSSFSSFRCSSPGGPANAGLSASALPFPVLGFPALTLHPYSAYSKAGLCFTVCCRNYIPITASVQRPAEV